MHKSVFQNPGKIIEITSPQKKLPKVSNFFDNKITKNILSKVKLKYLLKIYLFTKRKTQMQAAIIYYLQINNLLDMRIKNILPEDLEKLSLINIMINTKNHVMQYSSHHLRNNKSLEMLAKILISKADSGSKIILHSKKKIIEQYLDISNLYFDYQVIENDIHT